MPSFPGSERSQTLPDGAAKVCWARQDRVPLHLERPARAVTQPSRVHWADFEKDFKKNEQPVLEKLLADGVITQYGLDAASVYTADGQTHSTWFSSRSLANLEKVLDTRVAANEKLTSEERRKQNTNLAFIPSL